MHTFVDILSFIVSYSMSYFCSEKFEILIDARKYSF